MRTVVFTVANVGLTIVLGTFLALLLVRVSSVVRVLLTAGLVLVWSMPVVVAVQVWYWITNYENGILNYTLTQLHLGDFYHHDWYATTFSQLAVVTAVIVWGAIPFVTITVYAGLAQVPGELVEAAEIDGARPWRVFLDVTLPIIKPILLILTSLSIIWDFAVFTQPFLLIGQSKLHPGNYLMGVYLFEEGYLKTDFGRGAAISIIMLVLVAAMSVFYVRRMVKIGDADVKPRRRRRYRRWGWDAARHRGLRGAGLPRLLDDLDGVQAGLRDHQREADVGPLPRDDEALHETRCASRTSGRTRRTA